MAALSLGASGKGGNIRTILVCDDERAIIRLIQVNLEHAGYEVLCAFSGREALDLVLSTSPDFLIVDALMPDMDGYAVTQHIRADPVTVHLPILILVASERDAEQARNAGAEYVLTKPFHPVELVNRVRRG